jgi:hypothetical protein
MQVLAEQARELSEVAGKAARDGAKTAKPKS